MRYDPSAIRRIRTRRGLDLVGLATKAGISQRNAYNLDRGLGIPRADTLASIARALGVRITAFFLKAA